jgi:hypothetical protein
MVNYLPESAFNLKGTIEAIEAGEKNVKPKNSLRFKFKALCSFKL